MSPFPYRFLPFVFVPALLLACSDASSTSKDAAELTPITISTVDPGATQQPGAVLTPRPGVQVDMSAARQFEAQGDIESAAAAYVSIAAKNGPDRTDATLAAGRLLLALERYDDARLLLEPFLANAKASADDLSAHYLLARAYSGLNQPDKALAEYDAYIALGRPASAYAYLDRANVLLSLERPAEAIDSIQKGTDLGVPSSMKRTFLLTKAQAYERAGNLVAAIQGYRDLMTQSSGDGPLALSRIWALKKLQGDSTYTDELSTLLIRYPSSSQALDGLQEVDRSGETLAQGVKGAPSIAPGIRGLIYYRHNDYTKAEPEFRKQIDQAPQAPGTAEAYYYLAAIQESQDKIDSALANYTQAGLVNPASSVADDALWWRARILEQRGQAADAGALYLRIVNEYPNSQWATDAAFRRGMLPYGAGDYQAAADIWAKDLASTTDAAERQRLELWQAKAMLKAGKGTDAGPIINQLATSNEDDYIGIRALGLQGNSNEIPRGQPEAGVNLEPKWDWASAESWLAAKTGQPADSRPWQSDAHWQTALELWRLGRDSYGDLEVYAMLDSYSADATAMYTLSRALLELGRQGMSARAGQRLLRVLNSNPNEGLPKALMSLSYPAAFGAQVQRYASAEGVSPLLLLAFIRQESFFDPRAVSPVGALGLTQVLPSTAKTVAGALGLGDVADDQLLHADLNLRLGARYMADQLKSFDNEVFVAFAAYNAGPNAAQRWRKDSGDDADLYLETVEFAETRLYVEIVSENYAIYRYLYGNQPQPNLPN